MFWQIPSFSGPSTVDAILDKEEFTLEELLDDEEIIQECKALNTRLINFLRDRAQVEQLLRYIVGDAPEDADRKYAFKFPFVASEIFACEIDVILKTLVDEELLDMLFSFLQPNRIHNSLFSGYFSKVILCLMQRKTAHLMSYVQNHKIVLQQLVDLIGLTPIMEILVRLIGGDDHIYPNFLEIMQWLADSSLVEMIVDKLHPSNSPEVQANAAEVLSAIIRNGPSALASQLSSPSFITRIFDHALGDTASSKTGLIHSLSVLIFLLDPKRSASSTMLHSTRSRYLYESSFNVDPMVVEAMLPRLADLVKLLNVSTESNSLPTTFGEVRPPLGKHRLKIVEFLAVLLGTGDEAAQNELINYGAICRTIDLFFEYPFNNALHHHVERMILLCLESEHPESIDHLFRQCNILGRFLEAENNPSISGNSSLVTLPAPGREGPRVGYIGHITRISNKLVELGSKSEYIQEYLQECGEWTDWQVNVLNERNAVENVYRWSCGRPTELQEKTRESDEDELQERDYDVAALANNLTEAFRYCTYESGDVEEDVYFDDESAEVVISSLRLGDNNEGSLFTNSNWFAYQDSKAHEDPSSTYTDNVQSPSIDESIDLEETSTTCKMDEEEVVVGEIEDHHQGNDVTSSANDLGLFQSESRDNDDLFDDQKLPEWVGWQESAGTEIDKCSPDGFEESDGLQGVIVPATNNANTLESYGAQEKEGDQTPISVFEEDAEFVGVELCRGSTKAHINWDLTKPCEDGSGLMDFGDKSPWRVEPEIGVVQE